MGEENKYKHRCELRLSFNTPKSAESFSKSVKAEIKDRGILEFRVDGKVVIASVRSKDVVALRALVNSVLRIASVVESIEK